jgi:ABC-2 type transport system permease protein
MSQIIHILKYKFLLFIRPDTIKSFRVLFKNIGSGLTYTGFAIGAYFFSQTIIHFLLVDLKIGLFLLHQLISVILFIFFISVNVGNIIVSYATLYKSGEIHYLFTKPIIPTKIFFIKFLDNFFYSSSTLLMILFSFLAGYVVYFKLSIAALFLLVFNFIPFMLSAGSLGVIILLVIIRLGNRFGLKKVIIVLAFIYILAIILFFKISSPKTIVDSMLKYNHISIRDLHLVQLLPLKIKMMPNNWLAETAYWLVRGNLSYALSFTYLQVVLSLALFISAILLGRKWYLKTWLLNFDHSDKNPSVQRAVRTFISFSNKSFLRSQWEAIIKRDLILFIREPSQIIHFLILLFLIIVFIASASGIKFVGIGNFYLQTMIYLSLFLFDLLFIITLSLRFIFPLISLEGETFWKVKSSPISVKTLLISKTIVISSIILLISLSLSYFSNVKLGYFMTIYSVIITLFAALTIMAVNFGLGGIYKNYKEKNAIRLSSSQGATITFLINIIYMFFLIALLFQPLSQMFLSIVFSREFQYGVFLVPILLISLVSIVMIVIFLQLAGSSIKEDI